MKRPFRSGIAGFSLLEVMVIAVILSLLAAVAIPAFIRYVKRSKATEATQNIAVIYTDETTYYAQSGDRPDSTGALVAPQFLACPPSPSGPITSTRRDGNWSGNWYQLGFTTDAQVYFTYEVTETGTGNAATATVVANGNLDDNGVLSTFQRVLYVNTTGDVVGSSMTVTNELE